MKSNILSLQMYNRAKPYLAVIFLQFGQAGLALIAKFALNKGMSTYSFAVYRNVVAAVVFAPFAIVLERKVRPGMTFSIFFKIMLLSLIELEKVNIRRLYSQAKVGGTLVTVGGAMIMTLIKGPIIGLPWTKDKTFAQSTTTAANQQDPIKGSLMITAGCFCWASFYTLQGIICSGFGYYISGVLMRERGPVFVTAFSPLSMVIVAIMGSFILSEQMNFGRIFGAIVIVMGLYLVIWGKSRDQNSSNSDSDRHLVAPVDHQQTSTMRDGKESSNHELVNVPREIPEDEAV
ncbi:hypothetical protein F0562_031761 [Nyssa sinensis]|uniref:WAT1-related protein n=1 Tax=Nyssa sinensis TaxID=561372 RepID=A0A5J5AVB9_9ASTE|nr:hypothetical protein F0562_031761 [Nyssa sinensis]